MQQGLATSVQPQGLASSDTLVDRLLIRELLENWIIWRDAGDWGKFATVWHDDGRMVATWFQASASEFIAGSRKAFEAGLVGLHTLGGVSVMVQGPRATSQSRMQIVMRGKVHGVEVEVTCFGRFVDAFEKRDGRWGMIHRQPVYELDRIAPIDPSAHFELDAEILKSFPMGYRHLAYLQTQMGFDVSKTLPGTRGPEIEALAGRMEQWLAGADRACLEG